MTGEPLYVVTCSRCGAHQRPETLGLYCDGPDTRPPRPGEPAAADCGGLIELRRAALLVERRPSTGETTITPEPIEEDIPI